jgi:hypothetical protein
VKRLARLAAAALALTLGACAQFYSETPILTAADSVPAYGESIGGVELRNRPDDKAVHFRSVWKRNSEDSARPENAITFTKKD